MDSMTDQLGIKRRRRWQMIRGWTLSITLLGGLYYLIGYLQATSLSGRVGTLTGLRDAVNTKIADYNKSISLLARISGELATEATITTPTPDLKTLNQQRLQKKMELEQLIERFKLSIGDLELLRTRLEDATRILQVIPTYDTTPLVTQAHKILDLPPPSPINLE